jgi:hypothetical protein
MYFIDFGQRQSPFHSIIGADNNMVVSLHNDNAQEVKGGLGRGGQLKVGK